MYYITIIQTLQAKMKSYGVNYFSTHWEDWHSVFFGDHYQIVTGFIVDHLGFVRIDLDRVFNACFLDYSITIFRFA